MRLFGARTALVVSALLLALLEVGPVVAQAEPPSDGQLEERDSSLPPASSSSLAPTTRGRNHRVALASGGTRLRLQSTKDTYAPLRGLMVEQQIRRRGIGQREVLAAMRSVPRHLFVPPRWRAEAYTDHALPIGHDQTISQPYVVALMTELLDLSGDEKVLEIGTGSGYHSAVLSQVAGEVFTIEIIADLGKEAERLLRSLGFDNVKTRIGNGYLGWPDEAPFDAIILSAAPREIPKALIDQLAIGGKMVVPVGGFLQELYVLTKTADGVEREKITMVRFAPMTGETEADVDGN